MFTRKTYRRIKPMVIVLLFATLVLAMSSASAADDGIADDAAIADAVDYSVDEVSASSDDVAIDTESSDIYSVDDATVTEDDDASGEIIEDTVSDAASEEPKAPLASPSGSEDSLGAGTEDVTIDLTQGKLYGGDVCDFTVTFSEADAGGTVTVTIIDTTVPEDTNRRTFVYTIPVVSGQAKASTATSITVNGADASFADVLLWPYFRDEWDNGVQRFPDSVTIAYSGDDTYAPKTETKTLTVYPYEAEMEIDITQGQGRENDITYGNPLGLVLFEVYDPFEFNNPYYGGDFNVYIVNGDEVDPEEFDPTRDLDKIIKKSVVHINDGDGSITFDDIFEEGYYLIGIYFDEINHPRYNVWEGFNIIKDTQVGPFVVSSNGLAYQTLEEALAVATEEDTITVIQEGVYKGIQNTGLLIEKSVTIAAAGNLAVTFDCEENNNFITVAANKVVNLKDIKIINGKATNGGAVNVLSGGKLSVNNVNFVNNLATKTGGAINAEDGSYVVIMRSNFTSNTANGENTFPSGGAVCIGDAFAAITSSVFTDNQGGNSAGAVYIGADNFLINDCTFVGNKANGGSAGALWVHGWTGKVEGCTFDSNEARDFGGAIEWRVKEGTLVDSTFKDNKAAQGGAIHWSGIDGKIEGTNVFTGNEATQNGGAIFWEGTSGTVKGANFTSNKAGSALHGNAIYWAGASGTVEDSIFDSNTGGAGAIIWLGEGGNIKGSYFANNGVNPDVFNIYKLADDLNIEANTFEISTATIKADKDEYTYGDSAIITGNFIWGVINNPIGLIVDSTRGSTDIDFTVENFVNGPFTYELTNLLPGEYTVAIVDFTETAKNNKFIIAATALDDFIVNKAKADVTVTAETVTYPTQATVVVNANVPGTYTIRVGNKDYEIEVGEEGTASKVIDLLEPGTYDIDLSADLGPNYEPISQIPAGSLTVLAQEGPFVVSSNGLGYATLAEALAVATEGDTITVVVADTYTGTQNTGLTVDKSVTIKADEGLEVIFDAQGNNNFITVAPDVTVTLSDITVTNGKAAKGAGVIVNEGSTLNVNNVDFTNNVADSAGGAIYSRGTVSLTGTNTFSGNKATYNGGAIYNLDGTVAISGTNTFTGNEAYEGGAIFSQCYYKDAASVTIEGTNTFSNNKADDGGAAIYIYTGFSQEPALTVTGTNTFSENVAPYGGAIYINGIASITGDNVFTGNKATDEAGGAIYADYGALTLDGAKFTANEAPNGGAIYVSTADVKISNAEFKANIAEEGAALYIEDVSENEGEATGFTVTVTDSVFSGNTADKNRNIFIDGTGDIARNTFDINETEIKVNDIPYGEDEVINGTFDAGVSYDLTGSTVSLTINGAEVTATVTDGNKFTTTITKPNIGTYPVVFNKVTDSDNNVYVPENPVETSYTVEKVDVEVSVTADPVTYPTQATVVVNANIPGTYTIRVGNKDYAVVVGDTGSGSALIDVLQPGTYEIDLSANLGPNYDPVVQIPAGTLTVNPQVGPFVVESTGLGYATLAEALAKTNGSGDTITVVEAGTYSGEGNIGVTIAQDVAIKAAEGLDVVFNANGATDSILTIAEGKKVSIDGIDFTGANAAKGGAIYINKDAEVAISNADFTENTASTRGGAIYSEGTLTVSDCTFDKNDITTRNQNVDNGGAAIYNYGGTLTVKDSSFTNNLKDYVIRGTGGATGDLINGIIMSSGATTITGSEFINNSGCYGGAVAVLPVDGSTVSLTVDDCDFINNLAYCGAAIQLENCAADYAITNSRFENNTATGIGSPGYGAAGGAIDILGSSGKGTITNCIFSGNDAPDGAGINVQNGDITVDKCTFMENTGEYAAGLEGWNSKVVVTDSYFIDNAVTEEGAGIYIYGTSTLELTGSVFDGNTAPVNRNIHSRANPSTIERNIFDINETTIEVNDIPYGQDEVINGTFDAGVSYDLTGATVYLTINNEEVTATVIEGNKFTTTVTKPVVGTYPVVFNNVTDSLNNVYLPVNPVETSYTVYKAVPIVEVNDTTAEWGVPVTIPVKVTDENGDPITGSVIVTVDWTVDGVTQVVELDENGYGEATFVITGALGDATITANYTGNDNYESVKGTATLIINDTTEMDITVTANEVDYGEDTIITVTAVNARDVAVTLAKVNVTIDDGEAQELEVGADGTINLGSLAAGEHNIVVTANDGIHKEATNSTVAVVNPIAALINASADNYAFDETGKLIVNVTDLAGNPLSGVVAVEIDDELYAPEVTITGGRVEIDLTGFEIGEHSVHVVFTNPNYRVVDAVTHFNVTKKTPTISVEADDDLMPGDPAFVTVTVKDGNKGINGTAIVTVDGTNYAVEIIDGEGQVIITDLVADEYTIAAKFLENDNYTEAVYTGDAVIDFMMHYASYDLIVENITYGEGFVVTIKNVKDVDGNLLDGTVSGQIVDANGQGKGLGIITITNGEGSRTYTGLNVGNYSVTTYFDGMDDDYVMYYGDKNASATVSKAQSDIAVTYENGNFTITLDGVNGEKLNETVTVAIDGTPVDIAARTDNGTFSFIDNGIAPGDHTVVVSFEGNRNYLGDFANLGFNVPKEIPVISVTGATVDYGQPATVKFTVSDPDGLPVTTGSVIVTVDWLVDGETQVVELVEGSGEATFALAGVAPGTVNITVTYIENDKYASAVNDTEKITIKDSTDLSLEATSNEVTYGGDTILNVVATDGKGVQIELSKVNITIDGVTTEYPVDEDGNVNIGKLPAGDTEITVSIDDEVYGHVETKVNATVSPAVPDLTVTPGVGNITIDVKDGETPISGTATVVIDGDSEHPITVQIDETGHAVVPIDAAPGNHAVEVIFTNDNYTEARQTVAVTVPKAIPVVEVNDTTTEWGVPVTIPVKVTDENGDPLTGTVIVTVNWGVDGKSEVVELDENGYGEATFVITETLGDATITANYTGNDNYESVKETATLTITDSTVLNLDVTANEVTYGEDTILTITATNGRGVVVPIVRVNLTIGGVTDMYPVIDGKVTVGKLPAGVTEITVSLKGGVYQDAEAAVNATVNPAVPDLVLTPGEGNITIDVFDGDYPISGNATVIVDGDTEHPIEVTIDETGHAVVPIDAAPGAHTVEVTFAKENYENVTKVATVTVPKVTPIVYVNGTEVEYGTPATINITVTDEEGNPINGTVIVVASWEVDGETQVVELVDGKGEATFVLAGLGQGAYADINATYVENDNYTTAYNDTEIIKITPSTELTLDVTANEATFGEDTILTIVAKDGADADVPLTKVNVTVDGVTNEYDVDENGTVNLGNLSIGDHEITVSVNDGFHEEATADLNATVKPAEANVTVTPGEGNVTVEAKDKNNNPINGTAIIVVDGGEPIEVPIDETGKIEYPIDAEPGAHTVEVTFTNPDYENVTKTVVVNVPKYEATLTIANTTEPVYGQNVTIVPTLVPTNATGTITYYVDGSTAGTELAIGENFIVSGLTAGEHTIVAKYNGDGNYSVAESNTLTLNVAKAPLTFEVVDAIAYYPDTGTINVAASADDTFTILVNGVEYNVTVENGKGSVKVNEVLDVGEYDITWNIPDGDNYIGTEGSAKYEVVPAAPDFSIIGSPEINYGQNNTIIPTITEGATGNITYAIGGHVIGQTAVDENFTVEGLDVGEYTIVATYSGDNNYGTVKANFTFKVLPIDVVVSVSSDEVYYPNTGSINLTASAPGEYTVLVGNKTYPAIVTTPGETVTIPVTDLFEVGKYDINVTAPASQNYNAVDTGAIGTYVVSKAKSVIEVTYDNATGKITVTLEGEEDHVKLSETISVEVDGVAISGAKTTDGVFVSEDLELTPGKHSVFAVFVGNENYLGSYAQLNLDIPKFGDAEVTVSAATIKEGEDAVINITVKDGDKGLTGVVTVTLDGTNYAVDVTDGIGQLTVKNLVATTSPTTTYPITAKFNGNDEYAEATGTGEINVTDYNDVIIVIAGGEDGAVATLIDTDLNNITGKVNVTVDGVGPTEYDVVDGKVNIPISEEGDHEITVDFAGDETHPAASKTDTVYVGQNLIPTSLTVTVADIKYTEDAEVVVILKDEAGNLISGKVNITIGDASKVVTVTGGHASTKFSGLNANSYTVIAEFASDGTYASCVGTTPLTVKQLKTRIIARNMTTTAINVTEDGRIGQYFSWTLVDEKGRVLADKNVSIGFNANVYNRVTNSSGQARLQINLQNSGPYTFAISFLGDENYEGCFEVVKIDVNKQKAQLTASGATYKASAKTKTLSATYKTKAGNPIVGKTVKFTVNGKTYSAKTDSKGVAKVNVSLTKAGSYTVEVKAPATNTYAETIKKVTLKLT